MSEVSDRLSYLDRRIVESAKKKLPEMAEERCPHWSGGTCRETGKPCGFSACPLVDAIAGESGG